MEEDPCVPSDGSGGERKHRGEREGREEEGEKAYTIALGGYWIRNRSHTGYRRILFPTLTSLSHPLLLFVPKLRTIFSDGRRRGGAKSRLNALFARRSKGLPGVSFLPRPSHLRCPFAGADHAVDRIRRRTNLSIHSIYEPGFVLIVNFFLVNRDLMVKRNG